MIHFWPFWMCSLHWKRKIFNIIIKYLWNTLNKKRSSKNWENYRQILESRNGIRTQKHLVRKRALNHLTKLVSLAKWLSVRLRTKWLWVRIPLLSLKLQMWRLLRAKCSLTFRQTIESRFTLKLVRDMIITCSHFEK